MSRFLSHILLSSSIFLGAMAPGAAWAATIVVTTTADTVAVDTFCSLREAVNNVNAGGDTTGGDCVTAAGGDIISLPAGTYTLTGVAMEDLNASGDLDITQAVAIQGAGAATTIIDGAGAVTGDRVIHVTAAVAVSIDSLTISGGAAPAGAATWQARSGGGIYSVGPLRVTNSTISGNTATGTNTAGGGIYSSGGTVAVTNSTIIGNSAIAGGGICSIGPLTVTNSTISGNKATNNDGGGIFGGGGTVTVTNTTISGNSAASGGGIYSVGPLTVTNSTISGNSAASGGGIYTAGVTLTVTNSTISGNSAASGGGVAKVLGSTASFSNTIIASATGGDCFGGGITSNNYNIASDATCAFGGLNDVNNSATITASLGALANNGGPTQTHALLAGSPALDTGSCVNATDQRGISRPQGATCDIGAYETVQFKLTVASNGIGTGAITNGSLINSGAACTQTYVTGETVTLTATYSAGTAFVGWNGGPCNLTITNPCSFSINATQTIMALFATNALIVTVFGPGVVKSVSPFINCPTLCAVGYAAPGTIETLTATPTGAALFTGWTVTSGTCTGATSPCDVTLNGIINVTAKFDLPGCTSPTATNYNPSATINDGSCTFPAAGGGGGGGGLDNQPPYFPGGGIWLISPEDKASGNGDTPFVWKILTDLDGDTVTYYLYACSEADFADCKVIDMVVGNGNPNSRIAYGLGAFGAALLLIGFGFTHGGRRRLLVVIAAVALTGSASLIACGAGGGSGNDGVLVSACSKAGADSVCREKFNLAPGDYQWKVSAEDGRGGQIESEARAFTVK
ncbi:MAG: CSLREA domain-containing protein [Nitrospinota bacterium]|nr:CSLREA domain-containing protein [Nitrospinota bacterium]